MISSSLSSDVTPHHHWMDHKSNLSNCRVFGSPCWYVTPKQKLKKLDPRSRSGIFVGYCDDKKGFKVYDPNLKKIIASRDVMFDELRNTVPNST